MLRSLCKKYIILNNSIYFWTFWQNILKSKGHHVNKRLPLSTLCILSDIIMFRYLFMIAHTNKSSSYFECRNCRYDIRPEVLAQIVWNHCKSVCICIELGCKSMQMAPVTQPEYSILNCLNCITQYKCLWLTCEF